MSRAFGARYSLESCNQMLDVSHSATRAASSELSVTMTGWQAVGNGSNTESKDAEVFAIAKSYRLRINNVHNG